MNIILHPNTPTNMLALVLLISYGQRTTANTVHSTTHQNNQNQSRHFVKRSEWGARIVAPQHEVTAMSVDQVIDEGQRRADAMDNRIIQNHRDVEALKSSKPLIDLAHDGIETKGHAKLAPVIKGSRHAINVANGVLTSESTAASTNQHGWTAVHTEEASKLAANLGTVTLGGYTDQLAKRTATPKIVAASALMTGGGIYGSTAGSTETIGKAIDTATDVGKNMAKGKTLGALVVGNRLNDFTQVRKAIQYERSPRKRTKAEMELASRTATEVGTSLFQHGTQRSGTTARGGHRGGIRAMAAGAGMVTAGYMMDKHQGSLSHSVNKVKRALFSNENMANVKPKPDIPKENDPKPLPKWVEMYQEREKHYNAELQKRVKRHNYVTNNPFNRPLFKTNTFHQQKLFRPAQRVGRLRRLRR